LEERPEAKNLVSIYAALSNQTLEQICQEFDGATFSTFKPALADLAISQLAPITEETARLVGDPAYVQGILCTGAEKAREMSQPVLAATKEIVGFLSL
jgi:tryptophanyl-tRNA synthetase